MAVTANSIITPQTPKSAFVSVATAQAIFPPTTTPSNTQLLVTAGANGARLTRLQAVPQETTGGAGVLQVFRSINGGTSKFFATAAACGNDTVSATDPPTVVDFGFSEDSPMVLQANEQVYVATGIAKSFNFVAEWADY